MALAKCALLASLSLLGSLPAQAQGSRSKTFMRAPAPRREATLDLATGVYTRGPRVGERGATTIADFDNLDAFDGAGFGWMSVDTGGGSCRWFSNAAKGSAANQSQNASDLMTDVVFYYCSTALDPASGGQGGSVTLGFYEGYTVFGGAPTTTAALVAVTGMPANTVACGTGWGGSPTYGCFLLRVSFPTLVAFADGAFMGYSWQFDDVACVDPPLAATFPFLSCVVSCSGTDLLTSGSAGGVGGNPLGLGEDGQGMLDVMDQFCTAPPVSSTFSFGTAGAPFAPTTRTSLNMRVQEAADLATTSVAYNAAVTPNADTLSATQPTLGATWTATLTRAAPSVAGSVLLTLRRARHPLPNGGAPSGPVSGRVLVAGAFLATSAGTHDGTSGTIAQAIPLAAAFCGLHFAAQARVSGGGIALSSAVEGTIGTF